MGMTTLQVEPLAGTTFGLVADAHVHPGGGPGLPETALNAFRTVDAIFALGDMGDAAALDLLSTVAPVVAVRGADDAPDDPRLAAERRVFSHGDRRIGALFDGTAQGLFTGNDPFAVAPGFASALHETFGCPVGLVLCAGSHKPLVAWSEGVLIVNPGSPTLAERPSVALLHLAPDHVRVEHVSV